MIYPSATHPSGMRVVLHPTSSEVVYLGIAIGVGARHEKRGQAGLAHFIEHMLFKGTPLRHAKQIINRLEEVGGELNAYTSKEEIILYSILPYRFRFRALQLMLDLMLRSTFPSKEISKEKTVIIDEINSYKDSPSELIWDDFENILFRKHPLGHSILGTEQSVSGFTQGMLQRFFAEHFKPYNMVLFAQGNIELVEIMQWLDLLIPHQPSIIPRPLIVPCPLMKVQDLPKRTIRHKDTYQRHVLIGGYGYSLFDPRRITLSLLVNILGGPSMSSRLNMSLRETHGLVYHIECNYTPYHETGLVSIYLGCVPKHMKKAILLVYNELQALQTSPISTAELERAKRQLYGQLMVSYDHAEQTFLSLGKSFLHHNTVDSPEELRERIKRITTEEVYTVAQEIFSPTNLIELIYK